MVSFYALWLQKKLSMPLVLQVVQQSVFELQRPASDWYKLCYVLMQWYPKGNSSIMNTQPHRLSPPPSIPSIALIIFKKLSAHDFLAFRVIWKQACRLDFSIFLKPCFYGQTSSGRWIFLHGYDIFLSLFLLLSVYKKTSESIRPFCRHESTTLNLYSSGTGRDIKKRKTAIFLIFATLSNSAIKKHFICTKRILETKLPLSTSDVMVIKVPHSGTGKRSGKLQHTWVISPSKMSLYLVLSFVTFPRRCLPSSRIVYNRRSKS